MFAEEYLQMEINTIKKRRAKKVLAMKAESVAAQKGWWS